MKFFKKSVVAGALVTAFAMSFSVSAVALPVGPIDDEYHGALPSSPAYIDGDGNYFDRIGSESVFEIHSYELLPTNGNDGLIIQINTNYAGKPDPGNDGTPVNDGDEFGTIYGDLFLGEYVPGFGGSDDIIPNSLDDPNENYDGSIAAGEDRFQLALDVVGDGTSNVATLRSLAQGDDGAGGNPDRGDDVLTSTDYMSGSGYGYRDGQAVEVTNNTNLGAGTFVVGDGYIQFIMDDFFTNSAYDDALTLSDGFIFAWTMSCANEVIYGIVPDSLQSTVPIPPAFALLISGLLGLGWLGRARARSSAA